MQPQSQARAQTRESNLSDLLDQVLAATATEKYRAVDAALQARIDKVEELLPDALKGQAPRLVKRAMLTFSRVAKLQECMPQSFIRCVLEAAELGLAIDGKLCHAVPFNNKVKDGRGEHWQMEAQCMPDYKGLVAVAKRVGVLRDCFADVVCVNDSFRARRTINGDELEHERDMTRVRGPVTGAYAVFVLPDGTRRFELMDIAELHHVRAKSKSWSGKSGPSGPWKTDENEMYKKTVLRRGLKLYCEDAAMVRAMELDDHDYEEDQPAPARSAQTNLDRAEAIRTRLNGPPSQAVPAETDDDSPHTPSPAGSHGGDAGAARSELPSAPAGPGAEERDPEPGPFDPERLAFEERITVYRQRIAEAGTELELRAIEGEIASDEYLGQDYKHSFAAELKERANIVIGPPHRARRGADAI